MFNNLIIFNNIYMATTPNELEQAKQEMTNNISALSTDVNNLKTNAWNVSELAGNYSGFKTELQSTLEKVIAYINSQNMANTKTQSEVEKKLTAYKQLLVDYKTKITDLKKGDFTTLVSEINKIKTILTEEPGVELTRKEILQKANKLLEKTNKSGPQPPSNNTNQPNATNTSTPKLNPNSPGYAPTKDDVSAKLKSDTSPN